MKLLAFLVAVVAAMLVFGPYPPSVTMINQLLATGGWGLVLLMIPVTAPTRATLRAAWPLLAVFAIAGAGCAIGVASGMASAPSGLCVLGVLAMAAMVTLHGAGAGADDPAGHARRFSIALAVGGLCGAGIAIVQIFAADRLEGVLVALPTAPGRAVGNIGQSNQFADTLLWGLIALVTLASARRRRRALTSVAFAGWHAAALLMLLGVVLTASRTGMAVLVLLALWGIVDRGLARDVRIALAVSPVVALGMALAVTAWASRHGMEWARLDRATGGVTAFRTEIWHQSLLLVEAHPWLGVGWGGFGFAWSLTPFAARDAGLVDNAHDLPLQLAVELGVPTALLMMGLLLAALWRAARGVRRLPGEAGRGARGMLMIVVVVGLHSLVEYPLWFAHLLLPTAWAFGLALGAGAPAAAPRAVAARVGAVRSRTHWPAAGVLMIVLAAATWMDYLGVVPAFVRSRTGEPLDERIERARSSTLFSDQGDRAAAVAFEPTPELLPTIERASHVLVSAPLLQAWAAALEQQGQADKARYLAARVREIDPLASLPWFAPCADANVTAKPFQCLPPARPLTWRDFR